MIGNLVQSKQVFSQWNKESWNKIAMLDTKLFNVLHVSKTITFKVIFSSQNQFASITDKYMKCTNCLQVNIYLYSLHPH